MPLGPDIWNGSGVLSYSKMSFFYDLKSSLNWDWELLISCDRLYITIQVDFGIEWNITSDISEMLQAFFNKLKNCFFLQTYFFFLLNKRIIKVNRRVVARQVQCASTTVKKKKQNRVKKVWILDHWNQMTLYFIWICACAWNKKKKFKQWDHFSINVIGPNPEL